MIKSLSDIDLRNKIALVRVDFNEPVNEKGEPQSDFRIRASLKTIKYILDRGGKAVLMTHLGSPEGKVVENLRLDYFVKKLEKFLSEKILKLDDSILKEYKKIVHSSVERVILLENLRFHKEEEENDLNFAKSLSELGEIYVNEAFSNCHRDHASMTGVVKFLPSFAGFKLEEEIKKMDQVRNNPKTPFVFVTGGAKLKTKLGLLKYMINRADHVLVGGKLANTLLAATGVKISSDQIEPDFLNDAKTLIAKLSDNNLHIPIDVRVEDVLGNVLEKDVMQITRDDKVFDIGQRTIGVFSHVINEAGMVVWNGPMGKFEEKDFSQGTFEVARVIAHASGESIVGGGETIDALEEVKLIEDIEYVSTGGGAMLKYLEKGKLVAIEALKNK